MTSDEIRTGAKGLLRIVFPLPELGRRTSQPLTDITAEERKIRKVELVGDLLDAFRGIFQRVGHLARQGFVNPFRSASAAGALDRRREITRGFAEPLGIPLHRARHGFGRGEQVDERLADLVPGLKRLFGGRFRLDMVVEHMRRLVEERLQQTAYDFVVIEMVDACDFPFEKMIILQQFDGFPVGEVNLEIAAHIEHLVP